MSAPDMQRPRMGPTPTRRGPDWLVMILLIPGAVVLLHDGLDRLYGELSSAEYYEPFPSVPWWLPMIFAPAIAAAYGAWRRIETSALVFAALGGVAVAYAAFLIWPLLLLYIEVVIDPSSVR